MRDNTKIYSTLVQKSLKREALTRPECLDILMSPAIELLALLQAAFEVRKKFTGKTVLIHIIDNVQNGSCSEDCHYCAQSRISNAQIQEYPMKSDSQILDEAKRAYRAGAFRHCMVLSGREPSHSRIEHIAGLVKEIKKRYRMQVCVSPGITSQEDLSILKSAGLDRLNHNLNTSEAFYSNICQTHTFQDRINTLVAAKNVGLELCSGVIVGMGEEPGDVIDVALKLREFEVSSIPVNFFMPIEGIPIKDAQNLTPEYCLRVLCLYRFLNPDAEIRIAAGREMHLRSMQVLGLYPANSLFIDGYLNTKGSSLERTLKMIHDAGFTIESECPLNDVLDNNIQETSAEQNNDTANVKDPCSLYPSVSETKV